jgi:hypothetical protein
MGKKNNNTAQKDFKVSTDDAMNPELKADIQGLRGLMFNNLPDLNPRFVYATHPNRPCLIFHDTETDLISEPIGLCDSHGFIKALNFMTEYNKEIQG